MQIEGVLKQPFAEMLAFFRQKVPVPTERWDDVWMGGHDAGFMVAGAQKTDLLADMMAAADKAEARGTGLAQFRKDFAAAVQKAGWGDYTGGFDWRTRIIYRTNMATSYAAGRWAQIQESGLPYVLYRHNDSVVHPRPLHVSWDGLVVPVGSPWLRTHAPPNGWGCRCRLIAVNRLMAERLGGRLEDPPDDGLDPKTGEPRGIDKGWGYQPGATVASRLRGLIPEYLDTPPAGKPVLPGAVCPLAGGKAELAGGECPGPLPEPRPFDAARLFPSGKSALWYVDAFLDIFGATRSMPKTIEDVSGHTLLISDALFVDRRATAEAGKVIYKSMKHGRERFLPMLAQTLQDPQEIWDLWEKIGQGGPTVRRGRYLAWWTIGQRDMPGLSVFEWVDKRWWTGVTTFHPGTEKYAGKQRKGILRWPRPDGEADHAAP